MDLADHGNRLADRRRRSVRGGTDEPTGATEPTPWVVAIVGMLGNARHRQRMERLEHEGPESADEHRGVGVHVPDGALGPEQPGILEAGQFLRGQRFVADQDASQPRASFVTELRQQCVRASGEG
jgi:hypothetical protein